MIKIAVLGYGTIGSGVVEIVEKNAQILEKQIGQPVEVTRVLDLRDFEGDPIQAKITHDVNDILNDRDISIVVETMGGTTPAYEFVKSMLLAGKSVATSNKALVAQHGSELLAIATEKNVNFQFEASVGGGIPIIRSMYATLSGEEILEITGILNGTTNFMLTKMSQEGLNYATVLAEAQELGYAEREPSADVDGHDACRKIAILASLAFHKFVDFNEIKTIGIRDITDVDMKFAKELKCAIRLFASCKKIDGKVYISVSPTLVGENHALYSVNGVYNAVLVKGNMVDNLMFYGSGAGKLPTASAVIADVIEIAKNPGKTIIEGWSDEKLDLADAGELPRKRFVRFEASQPIADMKETIAKTKSALGSQEIIASDDVRGYAFITAPMSDAEYEKSIKDLPPVASMMPVQE